MIIKQNINFLKIPQMFWAPEKIVLLDGPIKGGKTQEFNYPLNDPTKYNFSNGSGVRFQTDHVFERIRDGTLNGLKSNIIILF